MPKSKYIIQEALNTKCPTCQKPVDLLCMADGNNRRPWFYICWNCTFIAELGKGIVIRNE